MGEQSDSSGVPVGTEKASRQRPKPLLAALLGLLLLTGCVVLGLWVYNETALQKPLRRVLLADPRNRVIKANAQFDGWINANRVVFDLVDVAGDASQIDVFRVLLQYAEEQKDRQYKEVVLAAYGKKKFIVPGDYFQQLGREYRNQNPVYSIRTFPHHVSTMDGAKPFPELEGGLFWVLKEEMDQFNEFNKRWYFNDFLARHQ